jgi:hypothetical protein
MRNELKYIADYVAESEVRDTFCADPWYKVYHLQLI